MILPPDWLNVFVNDVTAAIYQHDILSPLGCHYQQVDDVWEITVFASSTEVIGGSEDGRMLHSGFNVDVKKVLELFTRVDHVAWQAHQMDLRDELGPHIAVEGIHNDSKIWLRMTAVAPRRFEAGRRALVNQGEIEDLW